MLSTTRTLILLVTLMVGTDVCIGQSASQKGPSAASKGGVSAQRSMAANTPDKATLEKEFKKTLTGAVLTGIWQITGEEGLAGTEPLTEPKSEKYSVQSATKLGGDFWLINARMEFGKVDLTVPVPIRVVWAGDTAVITVDEIPIPSVGKYSARVLIYRGFYSGAWMSLEQNYGGILAGRILKADKLTKPGAKNKPSHGATNSKKDATTSKK